MSGISKFLLIVFAWGVSSAGLGANNPPPVRIAYVGGLTGNFSQAAQKSLKALQLAAREFNEAGGIRGRRIEILPYDNKFSPVTNISIFKEIQKTDAVAIAGVHASNDGLILAELAEKHRLPMLVASATHPGITNGRKFVARVCFNDDAQGDFLARLARKRLSAKRVVSMVDVSDSFTMHLEKVFKKSFTEGGGTVVETFPIRTNDKSFGHIIEKVRTLKNIDAIFVATSAMEASYFITQLSSSGFRIPVLGNDGWQNNDLMQALNSLKQTKVDAYFTVHWHKEIDTPESKRFVATFKKEFGEEPNSSDADLVLTYDAGRVLLTAIRNAESLEPTKIMESLARTKIQGVTGSIDMHGQSDPLKDIHVLKLTGGRLIPVRNGL